MIFALAAAVGTAIAFLGCAVALLYTCRMQTRALDLAQAEMEALRDRLQASSLSEYRAHRPVAMATPEQDEQGEPVWADDTGLVFDED